MAEGEHYGVIEASSVYNHHALARILGVADRHGECSKYILRNLLHKGLPFAKAGRQYFISGHQFNLWVQENSKTWAEHFPNTKQLV